jgi:acyl carrier protein phosphodiesterase
VIYVNYLFHIYLSGDDPDILTGNFMGDFIKGPLGEIYPPRLRIGLELHRSIDSFAQRHPAFTRSRLRLDQSFGLYRGILVDLYYDHFLASGWSDRSQQPLLSYLDQARSKIEERRRYLPERLQGLVPIIFEEMIPSYCDADGVGRALARMSRRVRRTNPLAGGGAELMRHYDGLREDFLEFLPDISQFAADKVSAKSSS